MHEFPKDQISDDVGLRYPWCREYAEDATFTLEALVSAHEHGQLEYACREPDGTADECALASECTNCGKPFMAAVQNLYGEHRVRLLAVRTKADAKLKP